jgi:hypothetical protein
MKRTLYLLLLLLLALPMTSCRGVKERMREKVRFEGIESIRLTGSSSLNIDLRIANESAHKLQLDNAVATLFYKESRVGTMTLKEPVVQPRRTTGALPTQWTIDLNNPLAALALVANLQQGNSDLATVSLHLEGKGGPMPLTISREKMPLSEFLNIFGIRAQDLTQLIKLR